MSLLSRCFHSSTSAGPDLAFFYSLGYLLSFRRDNFAGLGVMILLSVGGNKQAVPATMSLPAATALPDLKSRHRLFFLNRQRGIRGRGVDELEEESSGDDELEEESSDDELEVEDDDVVSTGTQANIKSPSVDPSPAILAASTVGWPFNWR